MKINSFFISTVCLGLMLSTMSGWGQLVQTIKDINTDALPPSPTTNEEMLAVGNRLYLATDDEIVGSELWSLNLFARFSSPKAIALQVIDKQGSTPKQINVFVADTGSHSIRRISNDGTVITEAGNAGLTGKIDKVKLAASFFSPSSIARDTAGNLYVADTANHVIRKITPDGVVTTYAGTGIAGTQNSADAASAQFRSPAAVAVDSANIVYVADTGNHVIRRIAANGTRAVTTFSGVAGATSNGYVDGIPSAAKFNSPRGIVIDSSANIFVADTGNHAIRRVDGTGAVITIAGLPASSGATDGNGRVGNTPGSAQFFSPEGVTLGSAGNLFVADTGNHTIRKVVVTASGVVVSTLAGGAGSSGYLDSTGTSARFSSPSGITVDSSENTVFVADTGNHVIRRITSAGVSTTLAGQPTNPGSEDGAAIGGLFGGVPSVIKDIVAGGNGSNPDQLTNVVGSSGPATLFFTAKDSTGKREIWKTDGSSDGTAAVKNADLSFLSGDGPKQLTNLNGLLYFVGNDGLNGKELWSSNGTTAGTALVKDRHVGPEDGAVGNLLAVNNSLIYTATLGTIRNSNNDITRDVGPEMWSTALTANAGALFVPPEGFIGGDWEIQSLRFFKSRVFFVANGVDPASNDDPTGYELFQVNPASSGSVALVSDINPGSAGSEPDQLTISGSPSSGKLYFVAATPDDGRELWMSDGFGASDTEQVKNINTTGGISSNIQNLTPIRISNSSGTSADSVVFTADDGINGVELWVSQGTSATTNLLKNITTTDPAVDSDSVLTNFVSLSPGLVVFTQVLDGKLLLWRTDGTTSGTFMIEDFVTEPDRDPEPDTPVHFRRPTVVGNTLYFFLGDDQLWKTSGADDATTVRIHRFRQGTASSDSADFTQLADGRVVFSAYTAAEGREPWITDGTSANTVLLSDVIPGNPAESSVIRNFTAATANRFFFTEGKKLSSDPLELNYESEIYVVNNSTVSLLKKVNPSGNSVVSSLFWNPNNSTLFFAADNGTNSNPPDIELWKSDGTTNGTTLVKEINTSNGGGSTPADFVAVGNNVYFSAAADGVGREIFKSDGTSGNTQLVKDISVGVNDSNPQELVVMGGKIYFVATGSGGLLGAQNTGRELWVSDGIPENSLGAAVHTKVVRDIMTGQPDSIFGSAYLTVIGSTLYFVANDGAKGKELWRTNGTITGTVMVKDIRVGGDSDPTELRNVNGKLFFLADDGVNGRELWTSNGTAAGTVMVSSGTRTGLVSGSGDADIQNLTVVNDVVTFVANDGISGREVWLSDGTTTGTFVAADFIPGASSSNPSSLFGFAGNLIFSASDAATGAEPRSALTAPKISIEQPATVALPSNGSAAVDFTPVTPVPFGTGPASSASLSFTIKNGGINNLRNVTASLSGLHAADFSISTRPAAIIAKNGSSTLVVKFTPKEGGERVAKLTVLSSDPLIPSFVINLSGDCTKETTVTSQPNSQFVNVGAAVTLSAGGTTTATTPLTLQWRRNGAAITGAVTNPLYLWSAKLTDAGAYTAQFRSNTTLAGTGTSDAAQLSVVEDFSPARIQAIRPGTATSTTTIAVKASSSGIAFPLSYQWKRSTNSNLSTPETLANTTTLAPTKFKNVTTATLTITGAAAADNGYYFCDVSVLGNPTPLVGGTTELRVFTSPPVVTPSQTLPVGIVGANYFYQISVDADPLKTPTTFTASPLPTGLKIDPKTGIISGVPTKPETRLVTLGATNGILPTPAGVAATLTVVDMPTGLDGVFQGLVVRNQEINGMAGGRIEVTVLKTGSYSGKLIQGATTSSFKGNLSFGINGTPEAIPPFTATVQIPRTTIAAPLDLTFSIDPATKDIFSAAQITSVSSSGPVSATVTGWKANISPARYVGLYNFGIGLATPGANNDIPQGNGYGAFTVAAKGTLSIAGKTADGETITCATHVGPGGQVLLYQSLYTTTRKGSISGRLDLGLGAAVDLNDTTDNTLASTDLDWVRPPNLAVVSATAATRTYRAGFGLPDTPVVSPVALAAFGGRYVPPITLLKITSPPPPTPAPTTANAEVKFTEGGVDVAAPPLVGSSPEPDITAAVTSTNTIVVITPNPNAAKTRVTPNRTTGAISGGFSLLNGNARTIAPLTPNPIPRSVVYQGLIVPDNVSGTHEGVGYFMLPQLPNNTTLITTTPILSGKMIFKKLP